MPELPSADPPDRLGRGPDRRTGRSDRRPTGDPWAAPPGAADLGDEHPEAARFAATAFERPAGRLLDPGQRGLRALAALAVVVLVVAAVIAWYSRPRVEPTVEPTSSSAAPVAAETPTADAASSHPAELVVSVAGRVRQPGLVRLPAGARVADALAAAGGPLPGTPVAFLNLARRLTDGELILVGVTPPPGAVADAPAAADGAAGGTPGGAPAGKLNLNTATAAQFDALPGVGPVLAARLVEFRQREGGFRSVADLRRVEGIGGTRYERMKDLVTV